ncbi:class-I aminoacyl-tRNA synthetase [Mactra antiquata]
MMLVQMLKNSPTLTWCVIRHTLHNCNVQQLRHLCVPASLYEKDKKWVDKLTKETMLDIENIWKERLADYDTKRSSRTQIEDDKKKFYVLSMFPYPSGKLHMGHVRVYTISDMMARYHRMLGHKVIHPMGWDAFGLPAENAAIERNLHPKDWTYRNIDVMKEQLKSLCCAFDWDRELATCDPQYYRWTQYIFLKMYEAGLAYQKQASVNWDPIDNTVLADEQIDNDGNSWRSGAKVEKKYLRQWYLKTTSLAQDLYAGLDTVRSDLWKEVITLQKHWIGECTGCRFDFKLVGPEGELEDPLSVFTLNPETLCGTSHIALSTNHRLNIPEYYTETETVLSTQDREVMLNVKARNPLTNELIPVVMSKLSEEIMDTNDCCLGTPCDSETHRKVAELHGIEWRNIFSRNDSCNEQVMMTDDKRINGLTRTKAAEVIENIAKDEGFGGYKVSPNLRDWLISRQRYWGTPIPIIHCKTCKAVPVPYEDLPVVLPETSKPNTGVGHSVLLENEEWLNVKCPKCGGDAKRETDTMDTFVDSSWYFLRYLDPNNTSLPVSRELAEKYMPVDLYIGGVEHAYLHLYYARFFNYFLTNIGMIDHCEPFVNLLTQGMVKGESYKIKKTGVYIPPSDAEKIDGKYVQKGTGEKLIVAYEKMSKSKHNGVDPQDLFREFGADMTRLCILSNVSPKSERNWNNEVYVGVQKWLNRVWSLVGVLVNEPTIKTKATEEQISQWDKKIKTFRNKYLAEINYHMEVTFLFNTAISRLHELTSDLKKVPVEVAIESEEYKHSVLNLIKMISPNAPMFSMECWSALKQEGHVLDQDWPSVDEDAELELTVLCNGEVVGHTSILCKDLNSLDVDKAMTIARNQNTFDDILGSHEIKHKKLSVIENWKASLMLKVPGLKTNEKGDKKGKKGDKSKKNKAAKTESDKEKISSNVS